MNENLLLSDNLTILPCGHLAFAGYDTAELAAEYGTPLYLYDEARIRQNCRTYREALRQAFGERAAVFYASKAASFKRIYEIIKEENIGIDVVSAGEIRTAQHAGFPMERAVFHSNNKTDEDIRTAMDAGVGCFVADCEEELYAVDREAAARGMRQKVMLRLTPGIDPHTYAAVATGRVDSKFGFAVGTGQAEHAASLALSLSGIELIGFHCHIGSQLFDSDVYLRSAKIMLDFLCLAKERFGFTAQMLDLGGGYGVRYVEKDPEIDIAANIALVADFIKSYAEERGISLPVIAMEPGRSIVADAGITLYTVGSVKTIPGFLTYVSVDGGMTDNIRYALYGSLYTVLHAGRMQEARDMVCTLAGRCCESGDILQSDISLPRSTARGDLIAVLTTGAYHYSMASNYNRIPRPPVVMLNEEGPYLAVRRETPDDLLSLDV